MKILHLGLGLALIGLLPDFAAAQSAKDLIKDLDSAAFKTRDRAAKKLLEMKEDALAPLKEALKAPAKSLESKRRLESLLDSLNDFERDGQTVNGLHLELTASHKTLTVGERMTLTTTLSNVSDQDLFIQVGWVANRNTRGESNAFADGFNLHSMGNRLHAPENGSIEKIKLASVLPLGKGRHFEFKTSAILNRDLEGNFYLELDPAPGLGQTRPYLVVEPTARLRMIHSVERIDDSLPRHFRESKMLWLGTVRSNDVEVKMITGID
jgi:hypothetical protein